MSSVLCNMKRVSITFLPHSPVKNRAKVLQTPSYTFIHYATPLFRRFSLLNLANTSVHTSGQNCNDITFFLTNLNQYILRGCSHKVDTLQTTMWTSTTSGINNKRRFLTLKTPFTKPVMTIPFIRFSSPVPSNELNPATLYFHTKTTR